MKQKATVGYSVEAIVKTLDGVTNSQVDETGTTKPLLECITSGVIRGAVAMVGCNNPKIRPDSAHIELMKKLHCKRYRYHRFRMFSTGSCKSRPDGQSCKRSLRCRSEDVSVNWRTSRRYLHMGSCVDISRMMILAAELAKDSGLNISQLPVVGCAPEWMSEKAVSIGNYVVATGLDTFLGVDPYVSGSDQVCRTAYRTAFVTG